MGFPAILTDLFVFAVVCFGLTIVVSDYKRHRSARVVSSLFPIATSAFAWDKVHYVRADTIGIGQGIWLFIPDSSIVIISGTAIIQFSGHYTPAWQIIGSVIDTVDFSDNQFSFSASSRLNAYI